MSQADGESSLQGEAEDGGNTAEGSDGTNGQVDDAAIEEGTLAFFSIV